MNQIEQANYKNQIGLTLSDRMKKFEDVSRHYLSPKQPIILRIEGKNFSSYTKQPWVKKPFSYLISSAFLQTTVKVCHEIQNVDFAYHQSDEVSFFLKDYKTKKQGQYFDGNVQKISSVVTSIFTYWFNHFIKQDLEQQSSLKDDGYYDNEKTPIIKADLRMAVHPAIFDCLLFSLPMTEVTNYFIWRQRDAIRNSVAAYAKYLKSWEELPVDVQRGTACKKNEVDVLVSELSEDQIQFYIKNNLQVPESVKRNKWVLDTNTPKFSEDRKYIDDLVFSTEEPLFEPQLSFEFNEK